MRRIAKMPLWAESRIHGDVYVRFGGRLSETYHRKVAWRRQPSLRLTRQKVDEDMKKLTQRIGNRFRMPEWNKDKENIKNIHYGQGNNHNH